MHTGLNLGMNLLVGDVKCMRLLFHGKNQCMDIVKITSMTVSYSNNLKKQIFKWNWTEVLLERATKTKQNYVIL